MQIVIFMLQLSSNSPREIELCIILIKLKNNKETIKSGSIEMKRNVKEVRLRIKKDENQFEFRLNDITLLTTTLPKQLGNYFGFQVENNFQGSNWIIEKYKLKEF